MRSIHEVADNRPSVGGVAEDQLGKSAIRAGKTMRCDRLVTGRGLGGAQVLDRGRDSLDGGHSCVPDRVAVRAMPLFPERSSSMIAIMIVMAGIAGMPESITDRLLCYLPFPPGHCYHSAYLPVSNLPYRVDALLPTHAVVPVQGEYRHVCIALRLVSRFYTSHTALRTNVIKPDLLESVTFREKLMIP